MMAEPLPVPPGKLTRDEYRRWAEAQPRGRYELVAGEVFAMAPERAEHIRDQGGGMAGSAASDQRRRASIAKPSPTASRSRSTTTPIYEPDALVNCGERPDPDAVSAPNPVVVVEVTSPGTQSVDTGYKLTGYFRVPSISTTSSC